MRATRVSRSRMRRRSSAAAIRPSTVFSSSAGRWPTSPGPRVRPGTYTVRLIVDGDRVQQWLNGVLVVEYTLWDEAWKAKVAASKFGKMPRFGKATKGHIALQDHGNPVAFRNIKIRVIKTQ